jgi:phosphoketolase
MIGHWVEGFWRAHQVPLLAVHEHPAHFAQLGRWLRRYRPFSLAIDVIDRVTRLQVPRRARQE